MAKQEQGVCACGWKFPERIRLQFVDVLPLYEPKYTIRILCPSCGNEYEQASEWAKR
jgi:hypothetical protein